MLSQKIKRIVNYIIAVFLSIVIIAGSSVGIAAFCRVAYVSNPPKISIEGKYKNVILMIGDGMGFNHIECGKVFLNSTELEMQSLAVQSVKVSTYSKALFGPTDSAAAATALSTGKKTDNKSVARYRGKDIQTNAEIALSKKMAVGIIATEGVKGATPAAFSSHADNRGDDEDIFNGQLSSGIDLFLGGAKSYYDKKKDQITSAGYSYLTELLSPLDYSAPVWGAFDIKTLKTDQTAENENKSTLSEISLAAIDYLCNRSENGFFLMIEESHIDKRSHANNMASMVRHLAAYNDAISAVVNKARTLGDTLVIATADHETGWLKYSGETKDELNDNMFLNGGHSSRKVPCFFYSYVGDIPARIDNTQIADICRYYILNR